MTGRRERGHRASQHQPKPDKQSDRNPTHRGCRQSTANGYGSTTDYGDCSHPHALSPTSLDVEQTGPKAVISGVVTNGWLKGNLVEAGYTQITCNHDGTSTDCFQGWLDILRGSKSGD